MTVTKRDRDDERPCFQAFREKTASNILSKEFLSETMDEMTRLTTKLADEADRFKTVWDAASEAMKTYLRLTEPNGETINFGIFHGDIMGRAVESAAAVMRDMASTFRLMSAKEAFELHTDHFNAEKSIATWKQEMATEAIDAGIAAARQETMVTDWRGCSPSQQPSPGPTPLPENSPPSTQMCS